MGAEDKVGAVQLNARLCGVSPPVTRRLLITEQASLAQLHAALQVAFGWSDEHLYVFQIRFRCICGRVKQGNSAHPTKARLRECSLPS
jgi:hypothetical protein